MLLVYHLKDNKMNLFKMVQLWFQTQDNCKRWMSAEKDPYFQIDLPIVV